MNEGNELKKILVLVLSCSIPIYEEKERFIRETWMKDALREESIVDFYFFKASLTGENKIDKENRIIYVSANDWRDRTFQKTMKALKLLKDAEIDYDVLLRVNISTYINIPMAVKFIQENVSFDSLHCYAGALCNNPWFQPLNLPFMQGEVLIFSKKIMDVFTEFYRLNKNLFDLEEANRDNCGRFLCDDGFYTYILWTMFKLDYLLMCHSIGLVPNPLKKLENKEDYGKCIGINYKIEMPNNRVDVLGNKETAKEMQVYARMVKEIEKIVKKENDNNFTENYNHLISHIDTHCYDSRQIQSKEGSTKHHYLERLNKEDIVRNFIDTTKYRNVK